MFFQEINFLKKNFFSNSVLITDLIFRLNSKYIGFLFYLISVVIMGRYFVSGSIISCETGDVITSKAMIEGYCLTMGLVTYKETEEVSYFHLRSNSSDHPVWLFYFKFFCPKYEHTQPNQTRNQTNIKYFTPKITKQ